MHARVHLPMYLHSLPETTYGVSRTPSDTHLSLHPVCGSTCVNNERLVIRILALVFTSAPSFLVLPCMLPHTTSARKFPRIFDKSPLVFSATHHLAAGPVPLTLGHASDEYLIKRGFLLRSMSWWYPGHFTLFWQPLQGARKQ